MSSENYKDSLHETSEKFKIKYVDTNNTKDVVNHLNKTDQSNYEKPRHELTHSPKLEKSQESFKSSNIFFKSAITDI